MEEKMPKNHNSRTILLLILLLIVVSVSGCRRFTTHKADNSNLGKGFSQIYTGTDGVVFDVLKGMPPSTISQGESFSIGILIVNKGADAARGVVKIGGYDPDKFSLPKTSDNFAVGGKREYGTIGGEARKVFDASNTRIPYGAEEYTGTFTVSICYNYTTKAALPVCIKPPDKSSQITEACKNGVTKDSAGQGSPVTVDAVQSESTTEDGKTKLRFKFHIKNAGRGRVTEFNSGLCNGDSSVRVDEISVYGKSYKKGEVKCSFRGEDGLFLLGADKDNYLDCSVDLGGYKISSFETPVVIHLSYGYLESEDIDVKVKGRDIILCPADHCKDKGMCTTYYNGYFDDNNKRMDCDKGYECCKSALSKCEREHEGASCRRKGECGQSVFPGECPGKLLCCPPKLPESPAGSNGKK